MFDCGNEVHGFMWLKLRSRVELFLCMYDQIIAVMLPLQDDLEKR
jgi:hypothetical protein